MASEATTKLRAARDILQHHRLDHEAACRAFAWPDIDRFNFARDWFDAVEPSLEALRVIGARGVETRTYGELATASCHAAGFLRDAGVRKGDPVLLMVGAVPELWELLLACIRLGAVAIPATTLLDGADLADRMARGRVRFVVAEHQLTGRFALHRGEWTGVAVGGPADGWLDYGDARAAPPFGGHDTRAADPLLLYFTSGTTSRPKLVVHDQMSYPVGHLSTMFWLGLQPGDRHLNISSPGWAKHAWSSVFAPWLAEAAVVATNFPRFDARAALDILADHDIATFCAPPTVWRMLVQQQLGARPRSLRELASAGEPLNPEIIDQVRSAWGLTIRDGFGQTETTALIGNSPGLPVRPGAVGKPLPGFRIALLGADGQPASEGEICVAAAPDRPVGLMAGYMGRDAVEPLQGRWHRCGDVAAQDDDGYITFVGRDDDVFKSSDYRISPFELESVLIEHPAVAEAAVVPSPDPVRLSVPKAFVTLAPGYAADEAVVRAIFAHSRERLSPYKRIRRIEIGELPKTISGKIRRVELRQLEADVSRRTEPGRREWTEEEFAGG